MTERTERGGKMSKTKNDEVYEKGVKNGLKGDLFDDFTQNLSRPLDFTQRDEIYNKGYEWGAEHRYDRREQKEISVKEVGAGGGRKSREEKTEPDSYFYGRDNDRSYEGGGGLPDIGVGEKVISCIILIIIVALNLYVRSGAIKGRIEVIVNEVIIFGQWLLYILGEFFIFQFR